MNTRTNNLLLLIAITLPMLGFTNPMADKAKEQALEKLEAKVNAITTAYYKSKLNTGGLVAKVTWIEEKIGIEPAFETGLIARVETIEKALKTTGKGGLIARIEALTKPILELNEMNQQTIAKLPFEVRVSAIQAFIKEQEAKMKPTDLNAPLSINQRVTYLLKKFPKLRNTKVHPPIYAVIALERHFQIAPNRLNNVSDRLSAIEEKFLKSDFKEWQQEAMARLKVIEYELE